MKIDEKNIVNIKKSNIVFALDTQQQERTKKK